MSQYDTHLYRLKWVSRDHRIVNHTPSDLQSQKATARRPPWGKYGLNLLIPSLASWN